MRISDWSSDVCSSDLFDRNLFLEKRTELVAAKVSEFLRTTNRFAKTIIFCETTDHAERMRQALVNANADLAAANSKYVMRITGDDEEGASRCWSTPAVPSSRPEIGRAHV